MDFAGGSQDGIGAALDSMREGDWPFLLMTVRGKDDVDVFAYNTPKSADTLVEFLSDETFIEHLKWAVYESTKPDSRP